jgi:hypothetical protein
VPPITTCQREPQAIPLILGTIAPKFLVRIAPTAMELVLLGSPFGECRNLFFGPSLGVERLYN